MKLTQMAAARLMATMELTARHSHAFVGSMWSRTTQTGIQAMTLLDRLRDIDPIQARRFERLWGQAKAIAAGGIVRHLNACDRYGVDPDVAAVREIIDDAKEGRAVYAEMGRPIRKLRERQGR